MHIIYEYAHPAAYKESQFHNNQNLPWSSGSISIWLPSSGRYLPRHESPWSQSFLPAHLRIPPLLSLNITDDYFKAKKQAEIFEQDLQQKDQEMYDLKHELISLKMQIEEAKKAEQEAQEQKNLLDGKVKELEKELDELLK